MQSSLSDEGLRIAFGIYRLLPRGGLEDNCLRIADALAARGHEVTLFVAGPAPKLPHRVVTLAAGPRPLFNHARLRKFGVAFAHATKGRFDRVVAFQPLPGADILFTADWLRDRPDVPWWKRLTPRFRAQAALEAACFSPRAQTRILGLARPQLDAFVQRYGTPTERLAIAPPTLSPAMRRPELRTAQTRRRVRAAFGLPDAGRVWLWLGLQPRVKGLDRVIEALAKCGEDAHLIVGGLAGSDRKAAGIVALARRRGVADRLRWAGLLPPEKVLEAIAAADLLAHPARLDVTGGVILEAIVNGLPAVVTDNCGFAAHVEASGAGRVVPGAPFDAAAFAAALSAVAADSARQSTAGIAYGARPELTSGIAAVCGLIEAPDWSRLPGALRLRPA